MVRMLFIVVWLDFFSCCYLHVDASVKDDNDNKDITNLRLGWDGEEVDGMRRQLSELSTRCVQPQNVMHLSTGHNKMPKQLCGFGLTNKPGPALGPRG